ncbi:MAG TPA: phosphoglucosamine mutase [Chthoniobacteraceae bacterium]|jgi:phosphoglucosamine mutase|nr:phosphoglucosamine mutase [Chthoniobacteraceae bacterium]
METVKIPRKNHAAPSPAPERRRIFGTDGVRGTANIEPVTAETALKLGRAAAHVVTQLAGGSRSGHRAKIVLGKDTRLSGYMLENALAAGIMSLGVDVLLIGPLPTPGTAYITRSLRADAGIVLSASHNAYEDNGIKFFRHDGYKLDDEIELRIENLVFSGEIESIRPTAARIGKATRVDDALGRYIEFAKASFPRGHTLEGLRIAIDVANGAGYKSSPCVLRELGANLIVAHNTPNGRNINKDCGSTYPEEIQRIIKETGAQVGITHDGDADRVLLCDENGELVDGDEIMAIAAIDYLKSGRLAQNTLVATVMSNFGLEEALGAHKGRVVRTRVGDRYVIEEMMKSGLNLGGEQSGHMIFHDHTTTGDGIVSALQILRIMVETGKPLSELKKCLRKYPQAQRNLKVRTKPPIEELHEAWRIKNETEKELDGKGRVLLRYSGTEPKIRLLIEGPDQDRINLQADRLAGAIQQEIGAE